MSISHNLKQIRAKLKITQEEFGSLMEVNRGIVNNYESGKALPPTEFLIRLGYLLGIPVEKLYYENLKPEDLPDTLISQVNDPGVEYAKRKNLYDLRDLVKEVKQLREELDELKKKS